MPYRIGGKGTSGCSGFPVVDESGKVVGCHPTRAKAVNHVQALYVNVPDASKSDTPMDVAYNATVTDPTPANPSSHINPNAGMRKPQYMTNFGRQIGSGVHDKRIVEIWTVKADTPPTPENPIMPTQTYQGCECDQCIMNNTSCENCSCGQDAETQMAMFDSSLGKADETPQEQPQEQPKQQESFFNFRDMRSTRNNVRVGE